MAINQNESPIGDFCISCKKYVNYDIKEVEGQKTIKGKNYKYTTIRAYCRECGEEISVPGLIDKDQKIFDSYYRQAEGIITKSEIQKILTKYNMGKAPLSLAMGFGEITITRYLDGQLPSKRYSDVLKKALHDTGFMRAMLAKNRGKIGESAYHKAMLTIADDEYACGGISKIETVTRYILNKNDEVTPLALQKLLYFIQGFYAAIYKEVLFHTKCEAWMHGPVYPEVYHKYKKYGYNPIEDNEHFIYDNSIGSKLKDEEKTVIDLVTNTFGMYSGKILEEITHKEDPWKKARQGIKTIDYSKEAISSASISDYFIGVSKKYNLHKEPDVLRYIKDILYSK